MRTGWKVLLPALALLALVAPACAEDATAADEAVRGPGPRSSPAPTRRTTPVPSPSPVGSLSPIPIPRTPDREPL